MTYEDPRDHKREIEDDPQLPPDREKEIKTDDAKEDDDEAYRYTDWASI